MTTNVEAMAVVDAESVRALRERVAELTQLVRDIDEAMGTFTEYTPPLLRWIRNQIQDVLR